MIFFLKQTCHSQTGGRGGRVPHLGKIPTFSRFFIWGASLRILIFSVKPTDQSKQLRPWDPITRPSPSADQKINKRGFFQIPAHLIWLFTRKIKDEDTRLYGWLEHIWWIFECMIHFWSGLVFRETTSQKCDTFVRNFNTHFPPRFSP